MTGSIRKIAGIEIEETGRMIVVIDCGIGNCGSVVNMFRRVGGEAVATADPAVVRRADRIVFPGVGAFDRGMERLQASGLRAVLEERVLERGIPMLGICLGMQMLTRSSEEGQAAGLGWIPGRTIRFATPVGRLRLPHMGWNDVRDAGARAGEGQGLIPELDGESRFYFVHTYHVVCDEPGDVLAWTRYGYEFVSALRRGSIIGVQFHPEKSHRFGMAFMERFLTTEGRC